MKFTLLTGVAPTVMLEAAGPEPTLPICCSTRVSLALRPALPGAGSEMVTAPAGKVPEAKL